MEMVQWNFPVTLYVRHTVYCMWHVRENFGGIYIYTNTKFNKQMIWQTSVYINNNWYS